VVLDSITQTTIRPSTGDERGIFLDGISRINRIHCSTSSAAAGLASKSDPGDPLDPVKNSTWRRHNSDETRRNAKLTALLLCVFVPVLCTPAAEEQAKSVTAVEAPTTNAPSLHGPELGFPVGEELVYKIYWGVVPVGTSRVTTRWIEEDGRKLLAIRYRTRSNKVIATIYPVDDTIESIVDPATFLPIRFTKDLNEGRHRYHETTTFDYKRLKATWKSFIKNQTKVFDLEPDTRDLVSFMYFMRSQQFKPGETHSYRVMSDEKIYDLTLSVRDEEKVKLPGFGNVYCLKIDPQAKFQGLFVRKGKLEIWVNQKSRMICTQIVGKVPVADIKVKIDQVNGPGDDWWSRKTAKKVEKTKRQREASKHKRRRR
jgi:hypothetical protein